MGNRVHRHKQRNWSRQKWRGIRDQSRPMMPWVRRRASEPYGSDALRHVSCRSSAVDDPLADAVRRMGDLNPTLWGVHVPSPSPAPFGRPQSARLGQFADRSERGFHGSGEGHADDAHAAVGPWHPAVTYSINSPRLVLPSWQLWVLLDARPDLLQHFTASPLHRTHGTLRDLDGLRLSTDTAVLDGLAEAAGADERAVAA